MMRSTSTFFLFKSLCFSRISANFRWGKWNLVWESFLPTHLKLVLLPDGIQNFPFVPLNFFLNFHRNFRHLNTDILNILLKQYPVHFVLQCVPLCSQSAPLLEQFIGNFFVALCSHWKRISGKGENICFFTCKKRSGHQINHWHKSKTQSPGFLLLKTHKWQFKRIPFYCCALFFFLCPSTSLPSLVFKVTESNITYNIYKVICNKSAPYLLC